MNSTTNISGATTRSQQQRARAALQRAARPFIILVDVLALAPVLAKALSGD